MIILYQTGLVFVGAIVAYKAILKKQALDGCEYKIVDDFQISIHSQS